MEIISAEYKISSPDEAGCPKDQLPEYALIGRSNVGKSSLINYLTGRNSLARISITPGKTVLINHFSINNNWYLVDLPGYGYAKRSKDQRKTFAESITDYVLKRKNLCCLFVLVDANIKPQESDLSFIFMLGKNQIPFSIVFTKTDKSSSLAVKKNIAVFTEHLLEYFETPPMLFKTSSNKKLGRNEILSFIDETNQRYHKKD